MSGAGSGQHAAPAAGFYLSLIEAAGLDLPRDARVLDFCCGAGADAYELRDRGFANIFGFDIQDYVERRAEPPHPTFRFARANHGIELPFPSAHFDFIYSNQVLEHVQDLDIALAEISRCLKPGGFSLHIFPSRWRPIECHIKVPFGGVLTSERYYQLWARMGIRNEYQRGFSARATAEANSRYARDSLNYRSGAELAALFARHFESFRYVDTEALRLGQRRARVLSLLVRVFPSLLWLYRSAHMRMVMLFKGSQVPRSRVGPAAE